MYGWFLKQNILPPPPSAPPPHRLRTGVIAVIPILGWIVSFVGWIFLVVCWFIGFIGAIQGTEKPIPLIGGIQLLK